MPTTTTETPADKAVLAEAERIAQEKAERIAAEKNTTAKSKAEPAKTGDAEQQAEAQQLDADLRSAARAAAESLSMVAYLIQQAEKLGVWKLVKDAHGKPYKSHHGYITDVLASEMGPLAPTNRNRLVAVCLDSGLSQRAAAKIAHTSPAVANRVAQGERPGERVPKPRPNPSTPPVPPQPRRSLGARAVEFLDDVSVRLDEIATSDLDAFEKKLRAVHNQVVATLKLRNKNTPGGQPQKRAPATKQVPGGKQTQERDAAKARHPAGSGGGSPADAA